MLYDYACPKCGRKVEVNVKTYDAVVWCHLCEDVKMDKMLSAPGFRVDGYNYKNGYSKKGGNQLLVPSSSNRITKLHAV